jgi:hypothetical protein
MFRVRACTACVRQPDCLAIAEGTARDRVQCVRRRRAAAVPRSVGVLGGYPADGRSRHRANHFAGDRWRSNDAAKPHIRRVFRAVYQSSSETIGTLKSTADLWIKLIIRRLASAVIVQECAYGSDDFLIVADPHMTARAVANESAVWNMLGEKLCVGVRPIQIIFRADRKRWHA